MDQALAKSKTGLTLVELLVCVAVLLLLAATVLPMLSAARESGRRVKCFGNLRQLSVSMNMYVADNNGQLPPYFYKVTTSGPDQYTVTNVAPWTTAYIGPSATAALLQCPTDQTKTTISGTLCSYSYNLLPMMNGDRISNLLPSSIALLWDGNPNAMGSGLWWGTLCLPDTNNKVTICHNGNNTISISINALPAHLSHAGDYCGACGSNPNTANVALMNQQAVIRRHSKRLNLLFLDGHTDWVADLPSNSLN